MENKRIYLALFLLFFIYGASLAINPESRMIGSRPLSLGKAFAGMADDASAIFINPAGIVQIGSVKLLNSYATPVPKNSVILLSGVHPNIQGTPVAIGYTNNTLSGIVPSGTSMEVDYTEQEILLAFANKISDRLALGICLNILTKGFSNSSATLAPLRGSGMDMGISLLFNARENLKMGLNFQNILPERMGGKFTYDSGVTAGIPSNIKAGISWVPLKNLAVNFDLDRSQEKEIAALMHLGLELRLSETLITRVGIDQAPASVGDLTKTYSNITAGVGLIMRNIIFDYTYYRQNDPSGNITSYISIGYLGREIKPITAVVSEEAPVIIPPSQLLPPRVQRIRFSDVPESHPAKEAIELMATAGLLPGYPDGAFRPDKYLTRNEMNAIIASAQRVDEKEIKDAGQLITRQAGLRLLKLYDLETDISQLNDDLFVSRADLAVMLYNSPPGKAAVKRLD